MHCTVIYLHNLTYSDLIAITYMYYIDYTHTLQEVHWSG